MKKKHTRVSELYHLPSPGLSIPTERVGTLHTDDWIQILTS